MNYNGLHPSLGYAALSGLILPDIQATLNDEQPLFEFPDHL
jgi:hypothetical protein